MGDDEHGHACTPPWFAAISHGGSPQRVAFTSSHALPERGYVQDAGANLLLPSNGRSGRECRLCGLGCHFYAIAAWSYAHDRRGAMAGESLVKVLQIAGAALGIPAA
ncbi:MAG: hypothetical protein ACXU9D_25440, partial [Xanthobacteraceae bacterium]